MPSAFLHGQQLLRCSAGWLSMSGRLLDGSGEVTVRLSAGIQETGKTHVQKLLPLCCGHRGKDVTEYKAHGCNNHSRLFEMTQNAKQSET